MMDSQDMVEEFHRALGQPVAHEPTHLSPSRALVRAKLIFEEASEVIRALGCRLWWQSGQGPVIMLDPDAGPMHLPSLAQELADYRIVGDGTAVEAGIKLLPVVEEVHAANMLKVGPDGKPVIDENGKIRKPTGWQPPNVAAVLERQARTIICRCAGGGTCQWCRGNVAKDIEPPPVDDALVERGALGRLVRETWVEWARKQPDVGAHAHWIDPWESLEPRHQEVDCLIGEAIQRAVLAMLQRDGRLVDDTCEVCARENTDCVQECSACRMTSEQDIRASLALAELEADLEAGEVAHLRKSLAEAQASQAATCQRAEDQLGEALVERQALTARLAQAEDTVRALTSQCAEEERGNADLSRSLAKAEQCAEESAAKLVAERKANAEYLRLLGSKLPMGGTLEQRIDSVLADLAKAEREMDEYKARSDMNLSDAAVHLARAEKAEAECARLGDLANERHAAYEQERIWHNDVSKRLVLMEQRAEKAESELRNRTNELEAESIIGRNFKAMFERAEHELAYMKEETGRLVGILQGMGKSLGTGCGDSIPEHAATVGAELVKLRKLADAGQEVVTCARPWSTHPSGDAKNLRNAIVAWDIIKGGA